MNGQLLTKERTFLHKSVMQYQPSIVFEVGTWKGGGSTYQIVCALQKLNRGKLYTCEPNKESFEEAKSIYRDNKFIELMNLKSKHAIDRLIKDGTIPDFIFFDGPEDEMTAMHDIHSLEMMIKPGCIFMMHDWDQPSIKAQKIRPYLEKCTNWQYVSSITKPDSVGMCVYKHL